MLLNADVMHQQVCSLSTDVLLISNSSVKNSNGTLLAQSRFLVYLVVHSEHLPVAGQQCVIRWQSFQPELPVRR